MKVVTFEEHSSVLATWWSLPRRPRTLVYFDAHISICNSCRRTGCAGLRNAPRRSTPFSSKYVRRLDVAVHEPLSMGGGQAGRHLHPDP